MTKLYEFQISPERNIPIKIIKKTNSQRISLRQNPKINGFTLTTPWLLSEKKAIEFIHKNHNWLIKNFLYLPQTQNYSPEEIIYFLGSPHSIIYSGKLRGKTYIEENKIFVSGLVSNIKIKIHNFFKKELVNSTKEIIAYHCQSMAIRHSSLVIRNTNSRWGSCSSSGRIMLSLKLALCPFDIIEYVIVHELCHLIEMNHSKKFWELVGKHYPDYKNAEKWLKTKGRKIPIL